MNGSRWIEDELLAMTLYFAWEPWSKQKQVLCKQASLCSRVKKASTSDRPVSKNDGLIRCARTGYSGTPGTWHIVAW